MVANSDWFVPNQPSDAQPGSHTVGGGGYGSRNAGTVQYRSPLDARRASEGQLSYADFPDGYLGTITNRREDKLLNHITGKLTQRSYQRGVHKGEKIDGSDYYWPGDANPMRRIQAESRYTQDEGLMIVKRFSPRGNPVERLAHLGKTAGLSAPEQQSVYKRFGVSMAKNPVVIQSPDDKARMMKMLPQYARTM